VKPFLILTVFLLSLACAHPQAKPVAQKHYELTGKVMSVDLKDQTAAIDGAAIKGYMDAMTMDYPVASKDELTKLHPGDHITATIDVGDDGSYSLSHIKILPAVAK
jgi:Cu/Ag efflux protein CusF